jgi:hypothetical protein
VSKDTVARAWAARGLKPHLVDTFKLSNDPAFEDKLIDVVGLYMNPPDNAIVLCMDEKAQRPCAATPPPTITRKSTMSSHRFRSTPN